jgi:hypothetical protein
VLTTIRVAGLRCTWCVRRRRPRRGGRIRAADDHRCRVRTDGRAPQPSRTTSGCGHGGCGHRQALVAQPTSTPGDLGSCPLGARHHENSALNENAQPRHHATDPQRFAYLCPTAQDTTGIHSQATPSRAKADAPHGVALAHGLHASHILERAAAPHVHRQRRRRHDVDVGLHANQERRAGQHHQRHVPPPA